MNLNTISSALLRPAKTIPKDITYPGEYQAIIDIRGVNKVPNSVLYKVNEVLVIYNVYEEPVIIVLSELWAVYPLLSDQRRTLVNEFAVFVVN